MTGKTITIPAIEVNADHLEKVAWSILDALGIRVFVAMRAEDLHDAVASDPELAGASDEQMRQAIWEAGELDWGQEIDTARHESIWRLKAALARVGDA